MKRIAMGLVAGFLGLGVDRAVAHAAPPDAPAPLDWQRVGELPRGGGATAIAVDATTGTIAVGDGTGVWRLRGGAPPSQILRRGPVRDLLYLAKEVLLAATGSGLHRIDASGRVRDVSPGPGAERRALRLAAAGGALLVATEGGAFLSRDGEHWEPIAGLPLGPVVGAALRAGEHGLEGFAVVRGALYRIGIEWRAESLAVVSLRRERHAPSPLEEPIAVAAGLAGADLVLLFPAALALRDAADGRWRLVRPALPPGAVALRIAEALGRLWLATDRGLFESPGPDGPWRRVPVAAGARDPSAVFASHGSLHAAIGEAVFTAAPGLHAAPRGVLAELPTGPPIERIHHAALAYLDLGPARIDEMRSGVRRRGWLPRVALAAGTSRDRDRGSDVDEAIVSGSFHRLVDQDEGRSRDDSLSLVFTWELGDLFYHPEQIDVSREAREVIELRDDVLDEITQLYFERSRVLAQLAGSRTPEEALSLRLRAAELAAGIDAWTGGWYSRALYERGP